MHNAAIKAVCGPMHHSVHPVRSKDFSTLFKDRNDILLWWAKHLEELLNCINRVDFSLLVPQLPPLTNFDACPSFHEVCEALKGLKNNKPIGPDGIPSEILKHGSLRLLHRLHHFISSAWTSGKIPQQWKYVNIITIYKRKRDKANCSNSRGISLFSTAGRVKLV